MSLETLLEAAQFLEQEEQRQKNGFILSKVETHHNHHPIQESLKERNNINGFFPINLVSEQQPPNSKLFPNTIYSRNESRIAAHNLETLSLSSPAAPNIIVTKEIPIIPLVKSPINNHQLTSPISANIISNNEISSSLPNTTVTHFIPSPPPTKPRTTSLSEYSDFGTHFLSDDSNENKRRNGSGVLRAGTREVHNKLEKNRRAHLKECFEILKRQLPSQPDEKKSSNLSILHSALRYIQLLRRKEREYEHEMERLAREKIAAQQKLSSLKKELAAQWDHIDFNTLLPNQVEAPPAVVYSNSNNGGNEVSDNDELGNGATTYSSPSSMSSTATTSTTQSTSHIVTIPTTAISVMSPNHSAPVVFHTNTLSEAQPVNSTGKTGTANSSTIVHPTLHLPITQVMGGQSFVVSPPTIQLVAGAQGLRVLQSAGGDRQLTLVQAPNSDRPLALVQTNTPTHMDISHTGVSTNSGLQETTTAITTTASLHKLVSGGVTLMPTAGGNSFRAITKGLTLPNGLSLCSAAVSLASIKKTSATESSNAGVADMVTAHPPISGLAPVAPLVVSQGSQLAHIIGTTQLNGKVTPLIKTMGQVPLMNTQYLSTTAFMKPEVVVNSSTATTSSGIVTSSAPAIVASLPPTSS